MISPSIQQERSRILEQMAQMDRMIRGHVSQQTFQVKRGGQTVTQGPYFLLQRRENGKNNCQRVSSQELDAIVAGVEAYQRFQKLAERYARLTEQLTWEQQAAGVKKNSSAFGGFPPANRALPEPPGHRGRDRFCRVGSRFDGGPQARRRSLAGRTAQ
jgi:hypothetical protein